MIYQLSYELRTPGKDYTSLYAFLEKGVEGSAIHVLRDTWWIKYHGNKDVSELCEIIKKEMGEKEIFFLSELSEKEINGWMASSNWKWLKEGI